MTATIETVNDFMRGNRHPGKALFQGVLTVAAEQQPCGGQMVEWVVSFAFSFQFLPRLAAVFAEEIGHSSTFQPMAWFSFCIKARFRCHTTYLSSIIMP